MKRNKISLLVSALVILGCLLAFYGTAHAQTLPAARNQLLWQTRYSYTMTGIHFSLPIDGQSEPVVFDTGSNDFWIPESIAKQLKLPKEGVMRIKLANGQTVQGYVTHITYRLGSMTIQARAEVVPGSAQKNILFGFSSLVMPGIRVSIDADHDTIAFFD